MAGRCCTATIAPIMTSKRGRIIIQSGANVWPHELKAAEALAAAGYTVELIRRSEEQRVTPTNVIISVRRHLGDEGFGGVQHESSREEPM